MPGSVHNKGTFSKPKKRTSWRLSIFANNAQSPAMAGNNIAVIRKAKGLSQTQLAKLVHTTLSNLGKLERGQRTLNQRWLDKIAAALDVEPYELIGPLDDESEDEPGWLPSDETLAFLLESVASLLSGDDAGASERLELAGLLVGAAIRSLAMQPELEHEPGALKMMRTQIAERIEREGHGKSR